MAANFLEAYKAWTGTAESLTNLVAEAASALGLKIDKPTVRTIRLWRTKKLLSKVPNHDFGYRQLIEALSTAVLKEKGWTLTLIAQFLPGRSDSALEDLLSAEAAGTQQDVSDATVLPSAQRLALAAADDTVVLLAQGILKQYLLSLTGKDIIRQNDDIPIELYQAMCRLGRLFIEQGSVDRAACIHDVLDRARYPLNSDAWNLALFSEAGFSFKDVLLVDTDLRVPTAECASIACSRGSFGEDNVIEHRLHAQLRDSCSRVGIRQHSAYTQVREKIGRSSLTSELELLQWIVESRLEPLQAVIIDCFEHVPEAWLIDGKANRCGACGTLMRPHPNRDQFPVGRCPLRQCNAHNIPLLGDRLDPMRRLIVARPQVLTYWTGPAIDELAVFDIARSCGLDVMLYPQGDMCDVSIKGSEIGIDVKSYRSPITLGLRLNKSIGGLRNFRRRIIAISDECIHGNNDYIATVLSMFDKDGEARSIEVMPVAKLISNIQSGAYAS